MVAESFLYALGIGCSDALVDRGWFTLHP